MPTVSIRRGLAALLCGALSTGCVSTWNQYPRASKEAVERTPYKQTLFYDLGDVKGMFGGAEALREVFRHDAPFAAREPRDEAPHEGFFVRVEAQRIPPHTGSGVVGYVSYLLLLTIPFRSTEGYTMRYHVYVDQEAQKIYEYDIKRRTYFWLLAAPFCWVSLLTPSESDAFEATGYQFFTDAAPLVPRGAPARRLGRSR